ncbi:type I methionyl aminopeptidase [Candidatus Cerribacteria bacterium 'Amazon FNV 2010 28 9']|uniref:Methionine aminopeptidase n=1 Tax=Candidatus Cerribacteria bacterium 'Amazon FNV 2010 28 9' TaxID=2081795 RepID=A0A317JN51_9BACT|nr:MAG: type I methionyl aminopeptidase [Candidatus Cerribacteria bacterium 'Amazon FNV 2010 28 9']
MRKPDESDPNRIALMREGGARLARVKYALNEMVRPGVLFEEIESEAQRLIKKEDATPSFMTVHGYKYATCITKNEGCCHGVPVGKKVNPGDLITIDVGLVYQGYHTDTSTTVYAGNEAKAPKEIREFMAIGRQALDNAIAKARAGNSVYDISKAIQDTIEDAGYGAVYQLTGHGVGKQLHEDPYIPCVAYVEDKKIKLHEGQTIAIEPMYAMGNPYLILGKDKWTYETRDKSLTGMFEDTVLITSGNPEILTR